MRIHDYREDDFTVSREIQNIVLLASVVAIVLSLTGGTSLGEQQPQSTSLGGPNDGKLINGVRLPARGTGYISNPGRTNRDADWGTRELVDALVKVGRDIEQWAPGAELIINDLGFQQGGPIPRHQSHQAGRDVDVLFYMLDGNDAVVRARAARYGDEGRATIPGRRGGGGATSVRFDAQRNWYVMKSLVLNESANLQRVFVSEGLRELMLDWAAEHDEAPWVIERAAQAMCEPAVPHDDHFHIRIFCTAEDYRLGCRDSWPIFPWRRTDMARLGIPLVETAPPRTTTRRRRRPRRAVPPFGRTWCPAPR